MHKGIDNYKKDYYLLDKINEAVSEHRTIFLDIDGVIQPMTQKRHDHDNEYLKKYLYEKYNDKRYLDMKHYDAGAVYYDWRPSSVGFLRELLDVTCSNIVLSSDWRYGHSWEELKAFFKLYDLDDYLIDRTPYDDTFKILYHHDDSINEYLSLHPEIKKYIVLDDINFFKSFGEKFRHIRNGSLRESDFEYARLVLNGNMNIKIENNTIYLDDFIQVHFNIFDESGFKFMYLDSVWCEYGSMNIDAYLTYILAYLYKRYTDIDEFFLYDEHLKINELGIGYKDTLGTYSVSNDYDRDSIKYNIKRKIIKKV